MAGATHVRSVLCGRRCGRSVGRRQTAARQTRRRTRSQWCMHPTVIRARSKARSRWQRRPSARIHAADRTRLDPASMHAFLRVLTDHWHSTADAKSCPELVPQTMNTQLDAVPSSAGLIDVTRKSDVKKLTCGVPQGGSVTLVLRIYVRKRIQSVRYRSLLHLEQASANVSRRLGMLCITRMPGAVQSIPGSDAFLVHPL